MTKPREKTREELQAESEDGKKKIRQFKNREKMLSGRIFQWHRVIVCNVARNLQQRDCPEMCIRDRKLVTPRGYVLPDPVV